VKSRCKKTENIVDFRSLPDFVFRTTFYWGEDQCRVIILCVGNGSHWVQHTLGVKNGQELITNNSKEKTFHILILSNNNNSLHDFHIFQHK